MSNYMDFLRLSEHKIFKSLRESLPEHISKTLNLLTVKDNVLFAWDLKNNCVLTLNVSAARSREGDNVIHQNLLPLNAPLFTPEFLLANESARLLAVAGPSGVLVLELPLRYPPYGAFDNNKEVVVCRSHSLDERLLTCSDVVKVKQVRFHPGSVDDNHVVVLTSDNLIRFYKIENKEALNVGVYHLGRKPSTLFPGNTKSHYLTLFGETAVDFDFGTPEIDEQTQEPAGLFNELNTTKYVHNQKYDKIIPMYPSETNKNKSPAANLVWPIYVLRGCGRIYTLTVSLAKKTMPKLKGPLPVRSKLRSNPDASSIICLNSNPQVVCCGMVNGQVRHFLVLPIDYEEGIPQRVVDEDEDSAALVEVPDKEVLLFESIELELGLTTSEVDVKPKYDLYLHRDESKFSRYFVTHNTGVHSVFIPALENLQNFANDSDDEGSADDLFAESSRAEYLVCTKTTSMEKGNPVIGFSAYYNPMSIVTLLANGSLVTLGILTAAVPPLVSNFEGKSLEYPLKKMSKEPFDQYIQKLLKTSNQPILQLSKNSNNTQKDCYELFQRASQVFREDYFASHMKVREEIEKKIKTLSVLKKFQLQELERMDADKQTLQEKAESLAEKYEDIQDKQDELMKRCERLLILGSQKKSEPSNAEKEFLNELKGAKGKVELIQQAVEKLKFKVNYQKTKMENWKSQENKKNYLTAMQENTIRQNMEDMTRKIGEMQREVAEYKKQLNLK